MYKRQITKKLNSFYKNPKSIAHKVLAERMGKRDSGNKPSVGSRVPFVYIQTKDNVKLQGDKIESPEYIRANNIRQIEAAIDWSKKHDLKIVIVGGRDAWMNPKLLVKENIPVILLSIQTTPSRRHEPIHLPYKLPKLLQESGVRFCISTDFGYPLDGHVRTLPNEAMRAITWGLSKEDALRSITLSAAEILEIDENLENKSNQCIKHTLSEIGTFKNIWNYIS